MSEIIWRRDGGPAFARPASEHTANGTCRDGNDPRDAQSGMSLRDWFAGRIIQSLIAQQFRTERLPPENLEDVAEDTRYCFSNLALLRGKGDIEELCNTAYRIADAMLAERSKGGDA